MTTTPGYYLPSSTVPIPRQLNLVQYLQTVLVGISGLPGPMVRPKWQPSPPQQPDITVDWLAFGLRESVPDTYMYVGTDVHGITGTQRQETVILPCSVYGPNALENYLLIRDGFQIPMNLYALRSADMGLTEVTRAIHIPDLVNERWIDRYEFEISLRREIKRTYAVPTLISAHGVIHTVIGNESYLLDWETQT